jgi:hypothetical protein
MRKAAPSFRQRCAEVVRISGLEMKEYFASIVSCIFLLNACA